MSYMEGLGRVFNVVPIAAGQGVSLKGASACTFVCTGNDTFTLTVASTFGGSYATPGNIITRKHTNTSTALTAAWVDATQAASNAVTISSGVVAFTVGQAQLTSPAAYLKVSVGSGGLVVAILHDLKVKRVPANLAIVGA
jgi:hypothetical protein